MVNNRLNILNLILIGLLSSVGVFGQVTYEMSAGGSEVIECGPIHTLTDGAGNYGGNLLQEVTLCPDFVNGHKVTISFTADNDWGVHSSDSIYIYDGPNTSAPLIHSFNSDSDPGGFTAIASFDNPTGCLTVVFETDGADEDVGFDADVACGYPCQPSNPIIVSEPSSSPAWPDTGYIDICLGDTVWLWGDAEFPHSPNNGGTGYIQTLESASFNWDLGLGSTFIDQDTVMFVPPVRAGYVVEMTLTDSLGCIQSFVNKIRVSRLPIFSELVEPGEDTICLGESSLLSGGIIPGDTVAIDPGPGYFLNSGGVFAGTTFLPDGGGVNYETVIEMTDFDPGMEVTSLEDIVAICVTMEHSFLGDLEMMLTCPNGTEINIFNSYAGGAGELFPGGFAGGNTFLGDANDDNSLDPGIGWEYCFSPFATWGNLGQEYSAMNFVEVSVANGNFEDGNSMTPGFYQPEGDFNDLIGCPLNGDWTLTIRDNWSIDNGYIFEWGILLSGELDPNVENYAFDLSSGYWLPDPVATIVNDTAILVEPTEPGDYPFTFVVEDIAGCVYDTVINVYVPPPLTSQTDLDTCALATELLVTDEEIVGIWIWDATTGGSNPAVSWSPDSLVGNPAVEVNVPGTYEFVYESACGQQDSVTVIFNAPPDELNWDDVILCEGNSIDFDALSSHLAVTYDWNISNDDQQQISIDSLAKDLTVQVTVSNDCGTETESMDISLNRISAVGPSLACDLTVDLVATNDFSDGTWTFEPPSSGSATFAPNDTDLEPTVDADEYGIYRFIYTDDLCGTKDSILVGFEPNPMVAVFADTDSICIKDFLELDAGQFPGVTSWSWDYLPHADSDYFPFSDSSSQSIIAENAGTYVVTASGPCGDEVGSKEFWEWDCNVVVPNVFNPNSTLDSNRVFMIPNLQFHPGNEVLIYDRWGRKVYEQAEYQNAPWDGGNRSSGVFFYLLNMPQIGETRTGYVHLMSN